MAEAEPRPARPRPRTRTRTRRFSLDFGALFGTTFTMYFRNIVPFTILAAIVLSPWSALQFFIPDATRLETREEVFTFAMWGLGSVLLQGVLNLLVTATLTHSIASQLAGKQVQLTQSVVDGMQSIGRALLTLLLVMLRCGIYVLAAAVLSALLASVVRGLSIIALLLIIPAMVEFIRLFVALPVAVMERVGAVKSVRRSIDLTAGSRWQIFFAWLLLIIITAMIGGVIGALLVLVARDAANSPWVNILITVVFAPLGAMLAPVAYGLIRRGKEHIDADEIAATFD